MLPEKIKILGLDYKVEKVTYISRDGFLIGEIDHEQQIIKIVEAITDERATITLIHEMIHGILASLGHNAEHENETLIQGLSTSLYQCFKDNPQLLALFR